MAEIPEPVVTAPSVTTPADTAAASAASASASAMSPTGPTDTSMVFPAPPGSVVVGAAPPPLAPPGPPVSETSLETGGATGGSLISQADRALRKGDTAKAVSLARQAVPANADAWLTLGAAYQASGNGGAARDAYKSCVKQAHFANVTECHALAAK